MVWSYIIDYENSKNPFAERKKQILVWKKYAILDIQENTEIIEKANSLSRKGMRKMDSLHIACAIYSQCDYFLTTDDKVLKKSDIIEEINIVDPFGFIKEVSL